MVAKGQILERPALIASDEEWLEGLYHRGDEAPSLLICPPSLADGGIEATPVAELAFAAARAGHPSLRFSHRGVGASTGTPSAETHAADARAALQHLLECHEGRAAIAGVASGCHTALAVARSAPHVRRLILVAPPSTAGPLEGLRAAPLVLLPELGFAPDLERWRERLEPLHGRAEVIAGADARFLRGLTEVGERAIAWLKHTP